MTFSRWKARFWKRRFYGSYAEENGLFWVVFGVTGVFHVQWNLDFMIWQGDRKIILLNRDIVVNELPLYKELLPGHRILIVRWMIVKSEFRCSTLLGLKPWPLFHFTVINSNKVYMYMSTLSSPLGWILPKNLVVRVVCCLKPLPKCVISLTLFHTPPPCPHLTPLRFAPC